MGLCCCAACASAGLDGDAGDCSGGDGEVGDCAAFAAVIAGGFCGGVAGAGWFGGGGWAPAGCWGLGVAGALGGVDGAAIVGAIAAWAFSSAAIFCTFCATAFS